MADPKFLEHWMSLHDKQLLMALLAPLNLLNITTFLNTFEGMTALSVYYILTFLLVSAKLPWWKPLCRDCRSLHTHFPLCSQQLFLNIQVEFLLLTILKQAACCMAGWAGTDTAFILWRGKAHPHRDTSADPCWQAWLMSTLIQICFVAKYRSPVSTTSPCFPFGTTSYFLLSQQNICTTLMLLLHRSVFEVVKITCIVSKSNKSNARLVALLNHMSSTKQITQPSSIFTVKQQTLHCSL